MHSTECPSSFELWRIAAQNRLLVMICFSHFSAAEVNVLWLTYNIDANILCSNYTLTVVIVGHLLSLQIACPPFWTVHCILHLHCIYKTTFKSVVCIENFVICWGQITEYLLGPKTRHPLFSYCKTTTLGFLCIKLASKTVFMWQQVCYSSVSL